MLDHKIHHCELTFDNIGQPLEDDCGRPKVKLKKHDFQIGGFIDICKRYDKNAIEMKSLSLAVDMLAKNGQQLLPWG